MTSTGPGLYGSVNLWKGRVVFTRHGRVWSTDLESTKASPLTAEEEKASTPVLFNNGKAVGYLGVNGSQKRDLFIRETSGGPRLQATFSGDIRILGRGDKSPEIVFSSSLMGHHESKRFVFSFCLNTRSVRQWPYIELTHLSVHPTSGAILLEKAPLSPWSWPDYKGGQLARSYRSSAVEEASEIILNKGANFEQSQWSMEANEDIYFLACKDGVSNIHLYQESSKEILQVTHYTDFHVKNFSVGREGILYEYSGKIYLLKKGEKMGRPCLWDSPPSSTNLLTKPVRPSEDLNEYAMSPSRDLVALTFRGSLFVLPLFQGAAMRFQDEGLKKLTLPSWSNPLSNTPELIAVGHLDSGEDQLFECRLKDGGLRKLGAPLSKHKAVSTLLHPKKSLMAISTLGGELILYFWKTNEIKVICKQLRSADTDLSWSPCGRFLAFTKGHLADQSSLQIYDQYHDSCVELLPKAFRDFCPSFSQDGNFLYFLAQRPLPEAQEEFPFQMSYTSSTRIFAYPMAKGIEDPFQRPLSDPYSYDDDKEDDDRGQDKKIKTTNFTRPLNLAKELQKPFQVFLAPLPSDQYESLTSAPGGLLYLRHTNDDHNRETLHKGLYFFDLKNQKEILLKSSCFSFSLALDEDGVLCDTDEGLYFLRIESKGADSDNKKEGLTNMDRICFDIDLQNEWACILQEAIFLSAHLTYPREDRPSPLGLYNKYRPRLKELASRRDLSTLIEELQSEISTGHAYEFGPQAHENNSPGQGHLGAIIEFKNDDQCIFQRYIDSAGEYLKHPSPLLSCSPLLSPGDQLLEVNSRPLKTALDLGHALQNTAGLEVLLKFKKKGQVPHIKTFRPLKAPHDFYTEKTIHRLKSLTTKVSKGRVGLIRIPDMEDSGHRWFLEQRVQAFEHDALIIDIRGNPGGRLGQTMLAELRQKSLGHDNSNVFGKWGYPYHSAPEHMALLVDEFTGSDADVFAYAFAELGCVIGARTWGGVIGIWPRFDHVDGSSTSWPEFAFCRKGEDRPGLEGLGVRPDIEVDEGISLVSATEDKALRKACEILLKKINKVP